MIVPFYFLSFAAGVLIAMNGIWPRMMPERNIPYVMGGFALGLGIAWAI